VQYGDRAVTGNRLHACTRRNYDALGGQRRRAIDDNLWLLFPGLAQADCGGGSLHFDDVEVTTMPHEIVARGPVQVSRRSRILKTLTVKENLLLGAYRRNVGLERGRSRRLLTMFPPPALAERLDGLAVPFGRASNRGCDRARTGWRKPRVLLLDEPSMV